MPDFRFGLSEISDVLNLFYKGDANGRIGCDGYNVVCLKTPLAGRAAERSRSNPSTARVFICPNSLWMCLRASILSHCIARTVSLHLETFMVAEACVHIYGLHGI